ncbi:MAG: sugar transferase, partial [Natronosporangium sp.]
MPTLSLAPAAPPRSTAGSPSRRSRDRLRTLRARQRVHVRVLIAVDLVAIVAAVGFGYLARFQGEPALGSTVPYVLVAPAVVLVWLAALRVLHCYDDKVIGYGAEEYRRVLSAGAHFLAVIAVLHFVFGLELARGFVGAAIPLAVVLIILGRYTIRLAVHRRRRQGLWMHRVLLVGTDGTNAAVTHHLRRAKWTGLGVVGTCIPANGEVLDLVAETGADTVAVTSDIGPGRLRSLAWMLEGSGVDLLVAPAVTDVAGPRVAVRPVAGLPLLHVAVPRLSRATRLLKATVDRAGSALALLALAPVLLVIAALIRVTSPGPVLYRQTRIGQGGQPFPFMKFRTMVDGADSQLPGLLDDNEMDGLLFKIRSDPRVTPVGRWLRRFSLDELPQLWHVLSGQMSFVGPRPPLPREVDRYDDDLRRRLLVKPGLTGLWQVNGRSDLPWEEAVRLDLYYVDHW